MKIAAKFVPVGLVLLLIAPILYFITDRHGVGGGCTATFVSQALSPTGKWMATINQSIYESPMVSFATSDVGIFVLGEPTRFQLILSVDDNGREDERPRIAWTARDVLQITIPNLTQPYFPTRDFGGVHIDLRYDPDDPAARAAWRRSLGERPDPDEPK